jgi:hypothetical protein
LGTATGTGNGSYHSVLSSRFDAGVSHTETCAYQWVRRDGRLNPGSAVVELKCVSGGNHGIANNDIDTIATLTIAGRTASDIKIPTRNRFVHLALVGHA